MQQDELAAWLRLALTPGVGNDAARRLLAAFGLPQAIFEQRPAAWRQLLTPAQAEALGELPPQLPEQLQATREWLGGADDGLQRRLVTLGDAVYPASQLAMADPPLMLYI